MWVRVMIVIYGVFVIMLVIVLDILDELFGDNCDFDF